MDATRLNKLFPQIVIRNRTAAQQHVLYKNGEAVQIAAGAERKINSLNLLQLPAPALFEMVRPTTMELAKAGIIEIRKAKGEEETDNADKRVPVAADAPADTVALDTPGGAETANPQANRSKTAPLVQTQAGPKQR